MTTDVATGCSRIDTTHQPRDRTPSTVLEPHDDLTARGGVS